MSISFFYLFLLGLPCLIILGICWLKLSTITLATLLLLKVTGLAVFL